MRSKEPFLRELARLRQEVNRLFEQLLLGAGYESAPALPPGTWVPAVDVAEEADRFRLFAELPGVAAEDVEIEVEERRVEISGERRPTPEGSHFLRMESSYGPFRWSLDLPAAVDRRRAEETFEQGVLELVVPKRA